MVKLKEDTPEVPALIVNLPIKRDQYSKPETFCTALAAWCAANDYRPTIIFLYDNTHNYSRALALNSEHFYISLAIKEPDLAQMIFEKWCN